MMNTIQDAWAKIESQLPKEVQDNQRNDLRIAFYLGSKAILDILVDCAEKNLSGKAINGILKGIAYEISDLIDEISTTHMKDLFEKFEVLKQAQKSTKQ